VLDNPTFAYSLSLYTPGFRLDATVLMARAVSQRIDCVIDCATEPCCRSINYKKSMFLENESNCEMLHNVVYNVSEKILKEKSSYDYVYLLNPQKVRIYNSRVWRTTTMESIFLV
jgi:hypothetical protein